MYKVKLRKVYGHQFYIIVLDDYDTEEGYPKTYKTRDEAQEMADYYNELAEGAGEIIVKHEPLPIPVRDMNYTAWIDGQEENGTGRGATEQEAIMNFLESLA